MPPADDGPTSRVSCGSKSYAAGVVFDVYGFLAPLEDTMLPILRFNAGLDVLHLVECRDDVQPSDRR